MAQLTDVAICSVFVSLLSLIHHSTPTTYQLTVLTNLTNSSIDRTFLCVTIDTMAVHKLYAGMDFGSPKLQNLAKELAPCVFRFGGGDADNAIFVPNATQPGPRTDGNFEITGHQWNNLTDFAKIVGWNLTLDLNVRIRQNSSWEPTNARTFLQYSEDRDVPIYAFELGNEVQHYSLSTSVPVTPGNHSRDFVTLRNVLQDYYLYKNRPLYGPGISTTRPGGSGITYLRQFLQAGGGNNVDYITFHHYYGAGASATTDTFTNVSNLDSFVQVASLIQNLTKTYAPSRHIGLMETATTYGGGTAHLSNAYIAGVMWLDKLGVSALFGFALVCRQTFITNSYGLVSGGKFDPAPDYYLSVLYKRLVEGAVFQVSFSPQQAQLRVYAACARRDYYNYPAGAVVVYYINLVANETAVLSFPQFASSDREVFLLTPGDTSGLTSQSVRLNDKILSLSGINVPQMLPSPHTGDVTVGPQTFGFIVIPDASVSACTQNVVVVG